MRLASFDFLGRVSGSAERIYADISRGCDQGYRRACANLKMLGLPMTSPASGQPEAEDYPVILRTGKGPLADPSEVAVLTLGCEKGWGSACANLGRLYLFARGYRRTRCARSRAQAGVRSGLAVSCSDFGLMHYQGDGIPQDQATGLAYLKRSCQMGFRPACDVLAAK